MKLFADFETRSECHLPTKGAYNYAKHPSTEIICCAFYFDDCDPEDAYLWEHPDSLPAEFEEYLRNGEDIYFRNAVFDRLIWEHVAPYEWPDLKLEQVKCTSFIARCNNLPGKLELNALALDAPYKKNPRGVTLINQLSIPPYAEDADGKLHEEMGDYCIDDVLADAACVALMREPTKEEWREYHANEIINDRGVLIDKELAAAAIEYADAEEQELIEIVKDITGNPEAKIRGEKLKKWVMARLQPHQLEHMVRYKKGEKKYSLDAEVRSRLLLCNDLDEDTLDVLECSDLAQKSSVAKFKNMLLLADDRDGRVRGAFVPNGASASGRYSSRGLQLHNFPREAPENVEEVRADLIKGRSPEYLMDKYGSILAVLSSMLRAALLPAPGSVLIPGDWSAIEGRVAPWLCDSDEGEEKLDIFRAGEDPYLHAATAIYHREIGPDDPERQTGKVSELACQFGGGANAIRGFARKYKIALTEDEALDIRDGWRSANPWAPKMWKAIEAAVLGCMKQPELILRVGRLHYYCVENVLSKPLTLFCQLPCGRVLTYPDIVSAVVDGKYGPRVEISALRAAWKPKAGEKEWPRGKLYGGLLFENAVQGTAASLLRGRIAADPTDIVMHVHDELVIESDDPNPELDREVLESWMNDCPSWAEGLPLATEAKVMARYGK